MSVHRETSRLVPHPESREGWDGTLLFCPPPPPSFLSHDARRPKPRGETLTARMAGMEVAAFKEASRKEKAGSAMKVCMLSHSCTWGLVYYVLM